jgi:hypothetical protein
MRTIAASAGLIRFVLRIQITQALRIPESRIRDAVARAGRTALLYAQRLNL